MSTRVFAAGCIMSRSFIIVAPSFEIVTSPIKNLNVNEDLSFYEK